jgi:DNA gyrase subunit A
VGIVTSRGRVVRIGVIDLPALPPTGAPTLSGGVALAELVALEAGEQPVGLTCLDPEAPGAGLALGTSAGVVKRVVREPAPAKDAWDVVSLKPGDTVIGAVDLDSDAAELVFVTDDAQLLRFPASAVRPQGRSAGGMAGIKLATDARAIFFGAVAQEAGAQVVTVAGSKDALPGTGAASVKVSAFAEFPAKGRATAGVRCHRFLKGEDVLELAWAGAGPARASGPRGASVALPEDLGRRDGSGTPVSSPIAAVSSPALTG